MALWTDQFAGSLVGLFEGSVRGIHEEQPPTRIANYPSPFVTTRLVVNPNHAVHIQ